jgi:O-antigen ligase
VTPIDTSAVLFYSDTNRTVLHRTLFFALLVLLAWLPIPIGSNREWSVALFEVAALTIFGLWALHYTVKPFLIPNAIKQLRLPLTLLGIWVCFPLIQLIPIPAWIGQLLSVNAYGSYSDVPGVSPPNWFYLSLDRAATLSGILRQSALVAVFFAVVSIVNTPQRLRALLVLFFLVGAAEAFYGLMVYFGGDEVGLWSPGHDPGTVSGTYVNQNHFAGLMEMTIPVGMGLLLIDADPPEIHRGWRAKIRAITSVLLGRRGIVLFGLLIMFAALILSTSRGAVGSLAGAVAFAVLVAATKKRAEIKDLKIALTGLVLVLFAVLWLGTGQLTAKLESSGLASNRADLRELSYQIISDNPIFGTGIGTYRWVFPRYKDERFGSGFYEHAHNDYLEILGEQGIMGFSLLAVAIGLIAARILQAFRQQHDPLLHGAQFAVMVGCTSLLIHGLVDFNLQIPANAAYFFALLGIGVVAAVDAQESHP